MPLFREDSVRYCGWVTRNARSHFALGIRLLPKSRRQAMEAVYAFCRVVDDVVDRNGANASSAVQEELARWRRELAACVGGVPAHPVMVGLQPVLQRYRIPVDHFEQILQGVEMDLTIRRYPAFEDLKVYCQRVASAVGLISVRIFGCENPAADRYATALGVALQLTNILRDIPSDLARGRIYLPLAELRRFSVTEAELARGFPSESFGRLVAFQAERAHSFFQQAREHLKESEEGRKLLPARVMGGIYTRLLERIARHPYDLFSRRVSVPKREQLWIATKQLLSSAAGSPD